MKHNKFNLAEGFSNSSNGKTSIGKVAGAFLIVSGILFFAYAIIFLNASINFNNILLQSLTIIGIGSGMIFNKINYPTKIEDTSSVEEKENNLKKIILKNN